MDMRMRLLPQALAGEIIWCAQFGRMAISARGRGQVDPTLSPASALDTHWGTNMRYSAAIFAQEGPRHSLT